MPVPTGRNSACRAPRAAPSRASASSPARTSCPTAVGHAAAARSPRRATGRSRQPRLAEQTPTPRRSSTRPGTTTPQRDQPHGPGGAARRLASRSATADDGAADVRPRCPRGVGTVTARDDVVRPVDQGGLDAGAADVDGGHDLTHGGSRYRCPPASERTTERVRCRGWSGSRSACRALRQAQPVHADQLGQRVDAAVLEVAAGGPHLLGEAVGHVAERPGRTARARRC